MKTDGVYIQSTFSVDKAESEVRFCNGFWILVLVLVFQLWFIYSVTFSWGNTCNSFTCMNNIFTCELTKNCNFCCFMHVLRGTVVAQFWVTIWYQNQMSAHTWFTCACLQYRTYILSELVEEYCTYGMLVWIWTLTKHPDSTSCFPQSLHHVLTHSDVSVYLSDWCFGEGRACLQLHDRSALSTLLSKSPATIVMVLDGAAPYGMF